MPTKVKLLYLKPAQDDFEEIVKYHIAEVGVSSAAAIAATMETTLQKLEIFPLMGQTHPDPVLAASGFRKLVLTRTYVAIYKLIGDTVYLYRIVNARSDYPRLLR
ncbi:MAG: type II toxin-antitoxin system RelE/ParE family toxin [Clostridia bacterium]|nr:type II toxin-antitoxin system RelE/ParE family toxin [Clostridia bacterium]MBQ3078111.1 type II toxin-antitoxin system RelE/ParE family toxin [Clostridia bacterium]